MPPQTERNEDGMEVNGIWLINWKEGRGGELCLREERKVWRVVLWMATHLHKCIVVAVALVKENEDL